MMDGDFDYIKSEYVLFKFRQGQPQRSYKIRAAVSVWSSPWRERQWRTTAVRRMTPPCHQVSVVALSAEGVLFEAVLLLFSRLPARS